MNINEFYHYSIDEIMLFMDKAILEHKKELRQIQDLSTLIINGIAIILSGKKSDKFLTIKDLYPQLFESENKAMLHKAQMDVFMKRFNHKKEVLDNG